MFPTYEMAVQVYEEAATELSAKDQWDMTQSTEKETYIEKLVAWSLGHS